MTTNIIDLPRIRVETGNEHVGEEGGVSVLPGPIQKRPGMKYVASFGEGPPLKLEPKGDHVRVTRDGKLVAGITKNGSMIRVAGQGGDT